MKVVYSDNVFCYRATIENLRSRLQSIPNLEARLLINN